MASHIVQHADRKPYRRDFVTGRTPKDPDNKAKHQMVSLSKRNKARAKNWKATHGMSFSAWVAMKMDEEYISKLSKL